MRVMEGRTPPCGGGTTPLVGGRRGVPAGSGAQDGLSAVHVTGVPLGKAGMTVGVAGPFPELDPALTSRPAPPFAYSAPAYARRDSSEDQARASPSHAVECNPTH